MKASTSPEVPSAGAHAQLPRRLGALDGAALVVANVVGVGIFTTPRTFQSPIGVCVWPEPTVTG